MDNNFPVAGYSDDFRQRVFMIWYQHGKPYPLPLKGLIKELCETEGVPQPSTATLTRWIDGIFLPKAIDLDAEVSRRIDEQTIAEKVQMLNRHAKLGAELQEIGIEYLRENGVGNARNAITAIFRGIEVEHDATVPELFTKFTAMTDTQLLSELKKLASSTPVEISPSTDDSIDGFIIDAE